MPQTTVVLDTNIFVAAGFNPHSASARLVEAVKAGQLRMVWSDATRREIERIMHQIPPLRNYPIAELFDPINHITDLPAVDQFQVIPDPDDRKFAALAQAAEAILISNDEHLLGYQAQLEVTVMTPGAFRQA
jgi:putative PIN family toxin of toxin-antitoxin system